jgi:hypothetical protein
MANHLEGYLAEAIDPILREAVKRLNGDLSQNDLLVFVTALYKAGFVGAQQGAREAFAQTMEQLPKVKFTGFQAPVAPPDLWAERHGGDRS